VELYFFSPYVPSWLEKGQLYPLLAFPYVLQEQELHLPLLQLGLSVAFEIWRL
jgi:hypothetical protein